VLGHPEHGFWIETLLGKIGRLGVEAWSDFRVLLLGGKVAVGAHRRILPRSFEDELFVTEIWHFDVPRTCRDRAVANDFD
jgi:hypothetical protein